MAQIPFIVHTAVVAEGLPVLALLTRRNLSRPVLWVAAGATVSVVANLLGRLAAARLGNNAWLSAILDPAMFALYLAAFEEWQITYLERLTFRSALFIALVAGVGLIAFVEDVTTLSRFAIPMYSLVLMTGGVWTLLRRSFRTSYRRIWYTDWFWIAGGLSLYCATTLLTQPVGAALLSARRIDLFIQVWEFRAVWVDLAFLAVTAGCLIPPAQLDPPR